MRILITGATGLVGGELIKKCHDQGIAVNYLTTRKSKLSDTPDEKGFYWNPKLGEIDKACFEGVDAIINLVGANVAKRWTKAYKKEIYSSRTDSAKLLIDTLKELPGHQVEQIVSASAIGIYQDSETTLHTEESKELGDSFLADVVKKWESAVNGFKELGIKVVKIRIGIVLAEKGGALPKMAAPIKFYAGAALGSGKQWQSWIHIDDLASLFLFAVSKNIDGIINGTAPNPVTNKKLTREIAQVLKRPLFLPNVPRFMMKLMLGEMHILPFMSQRVSAKKAENLGFHFKYANLHAALQHLLP